MKVLKFGLYFDKKHKVYKMLKDLSLPETLNKMLKRPNPSKSMTQEGMKFMQDGNEIQKSLIKR